MPHARLMFIINTNTYSNGNKNTSDEQKVEMPLFDLDSRPKSRVNNVHYVHTLTGRFIKGLASLVLATGVLTRVAFPARK